MIARVVAVTKSDSNTADRSAHRGLKGWAITRLTTKAQLGHNHLPVELPKSFKIPIGAEYPRARILRAR